jgi:hypothetical protein
MTGAKLGDDEFVGGCTSAHLGRNAMMKKTFSRSGRCCPVSSNLEGRNHAAS